MPPGRVQKRVAAFYRKTLWQHERFLIFRLAVMDGTVGADPWRQFGVLPHGKSPGVVHRSGMGQPDKKRREMALYCEAALAGACPVVAIRAAWNAIVVGDNAACDGLEGKVIDDFSGSGIRLGRQGAFRSWTEPADPDRAVMKRTAGPPPGPRVPGGSQPITGAGYRRRQDKDIQDQE